MTERESGKTGQARPSLYELQLPRFSEPKHLQSANTDEEMKTKESVLDRIFGDFWRFCGLDGDDTGTAAPQRKTAQDGDAGDGDSVKRSKPGVAAGGNAPVSGGSSTSGSGASGSGEGSGKNAEASKPAQGESKPA